MSDIWRQRFRENREQLRDDIAKDNIVNWGKTDPGNRIDEFLQRDRQLIEEFAAENRRIEKGIEEFWRVTNEFKKNQAEEAAARSNRLALISQAESLEPVRENKDPIVRTSSTPDTVVMLIIAIVFVVTFGYWTCKKIKRIWA